MKKWEYKILDGHELIAYAPWDEEKMRHNKKGIRWKTALDNLGKKGWELVQHDGSSVHGFGHHGLSVYVFKREKK
jgi:hypothetical protein